ncbi:hypothetical protein HPB51_004670 [Rhipicephalus microplus]|uniref:Uncharacterized protein n=1 Tax=Rhipicephalus microplus TaxID=6941 RepID=A0A9J6EYF1_RHIMP|nr:hypothetical protein HPB51_004670 [Rhipicephalus microplus]
MRLYATLLHLAYGTTKVARWGLGMRPPPVHPRVSVDNAAPYQGSRVYCLHGLPFYANVFQKHFEVCDNSEPSVHSSPRVSRTVFKLPNTSPANGLSLGSVEAKLAISTKRPAKCESAHESEAATAHGGAKKVQYSIESIKSTNKGSGASRSPQYVEPLSGRPLLLRVERSSDDEEVDKSEELSDIINFLIETDPRRSRESCGVLDVSSDDTERSFSPPVRICEKERGRVGPSPPRVKTDAEVAKPLLLSRERAEASPLSIVLPAPDIYGFTYQPDYAFPSVASAPSQSKATSADAKDEASLRLVITTLDAEMSETRGSEQTADEAADACQVPNAGGKEIHEKTTTASPLVNNDAVEKSDIANKGCAPSDGLLLKTDGDISQDPSDGGPDANSNVTRPLIRTQGHLVRRKIAPLVSTAVVTTVTPTVAAALRKSVNCVLRPNRLFRRLRRRLPSRIPVNRVRAELEDVKKGSQASPSTKAGDDDVDVVSAPREYLGLTLPDDRRKACDSDAESDSTEALRWSPGRASRSISAEYTREGCGETTNTAGDEASDNVVGSVVDPSNQPVEKVKREDASSLLNGAGDLKPSESTEESTASAGTRNLSPLTED